MPKLSIPPEEAAYFEHMLESARALVLFVQGKTRQHLDEERLLQSAVVREFEVLGEAAGKVSREVRQQFPDLPWKRMIGMRNRLIHGYIDVDYNIVWDSIHQAIPLVIEQLEKIISELA